jgi:FtsP/CotA-like multicopper oxidase with cupredoxin domain
VDCPVVEPGVLTEMNERENIMERNKFVKMMCLLVLAAFWLSCGVDQAFAQSGKLKGKDPNSIIERIKKDRALIEQRKAAAERLAKQRKALADKGITSSVIAPPGGVPDYFGVANWANSPALRKFVDTLPGLTAANASSTLGTYISVAVPDTASYPGSDYYEIGVVEYTQKMHSDLPATTLRGYVQLNDPVNPVTRDGAGNIVAWPQPHYLGPVIVSAKNRPVRIKFTNLLPTGSGGDLFVPVDTTVMGSGMGPLGMAAMPMNFTQNRADLHLHGGRNPWISDGTPHQWITPEGEMTPYSKGVSLQNVPDMPDPGPGSSTYYYTNQQSSRLMFYHDHSWGITRLNVYVGEAAGYLITDPNEEGLINSNVIPSLPGIYRYGIPLIIQDKSFVDATTVRVTDPTWNGGTGTPDANGVRPPVTGDLWYPHVYVPAQNPYDIGGANAYGRWHYGPWFWPPTDVPFLPIPNPYCLPTPPAPGSYPNGTYDNSLAPWEPPYMPATPNPSIPGESFMDVAVVNGAAYPTITVEPKAYRFRILNAANDRFFNLQMYVADPNVVSSDGRANTEVNMVAAVATPGFPALWPTDGREGGVPNPAAMGPSWVQIGTEGGFLPQPAVIPNQPVTWNANPTTFNFGNIVDHSLLLGTAERADVIVDFSQYAGKTLIVYNDAPAAFPALDARYDYYTGAPDLTGEGGHSGPQAGFAPNTRTIMQIVVANTAAAPAFDNPDPAINDGLAQLNAAFASTAGSDGVFKRSQDPIIVGQTAYNTAYNMTFPSTWPNWGISRIQDNSLSFMTPAGTILTIPMEPKAIQDEMGEAFDEYGRMAGRLGLELAKTTAGIQTFVLQNYVDPATEDINDCVITGVATAGDGTQIWKITHNGVDTHTIHFHLFDVQLLNRVGWDGAIRLPDKNELGWKDTIRISPLEDTIVALRAVGPRLPFGQPDSVRPLNPMEPLGSMNGFSQIDPYTGDIKEGGETPDPDVNRLFNFGWEYVWHCHILSHEEMDMMRPVKFNVARNLPAAPVLTVLGPTEALLTWTDGTPPTPVYPELGNTWGSPASEVGFRIERADNGGAFAPLATAIANATNYTDATIDPLSSYQYRVVAFNAAGESVSNTVQLGAPPAVNLALGRPTAASTTYASFLASNATDGVAASRWSSAFSNNQWIYVDLGSVATIQRVVLNWEAAYGRSYNIQVSDDAVSWTNVYSTTTGNGGIDDITLAAPATGRYVRMLGIQRATGWGYSLYEFEVYGVAGPPPPPPAGNLALGRPTVASTTYASFLASNATDGVAASRWSSAFSNNQWIYVDLGSVATIQRVVLNWEAAYGQSYIIEVSNDAISWMSVYSTTTGNGGIDDITLAAPATGRYVRMLGIQRATGWGYSLYEFEVY